jgi:glycosyltransferase involved in cell wall biosynthesis
MPFLRKKPVSKPIHLTRIARVSTVPLFIFTLLRTQVEAIRDSGACVTIITSPDEMMEQFKSIESCDFKPLVIERDISPWSDVLSLLQLIRLFRREKFDIVHSNTPKAGLLCAIAGKLCGVPIRLHTFTGQTWVTMNGLKRCILKFCDKIIAGLNTYCYADSPSQRDFLIEKKIIQTEKIKVLGGGSLAGVDTLRFNEAKFSMLEKAHIRASLQIREDELVLLFLGRITREKGIFELIETVGQILNDHLNITLLMAGPFEQGIEVEVKAYAKEQCKEKAIFSGFCVQPEKFIAIADLLCLPSYREGFGTVVIEAAAMGVPAVGSRIYGLTDAIVDGETGLLVEPKRVEELKEALLKLICDHELRHKMGQNAKSRAITEFDSKKFGLLLVQDYEKLLMS